MLNNILLNHILYQKNKEKGEIQDIFLDTSIGVFKIYPACFDLVLIDNINLMNKIIEIEDLKQKYANLYISEVRRSYDNNLYLLISDKLIIAIEYVFNSYSKNSIQEFRIIDNIYDSNLADFEEFKEQDVVEFP
jgi:hypothetical protein